MTDRNKWIVLVSKLLEATQKNSIRWTRYASTEGVGSPGERVRQAFDTKFMGRNFRVYSYDEKHYTDVNEFDWQESVKLEFVDFGGNTLFEVPFVEGTWDLLKAVQYQTADVDEFLSKLAG